MSNKMLIDATHPEETRVVVLRGNRVEEFDFEAADRQQLRGNIYLAKVTRVEPSLQAAFVEYGGNRHGFLAFSEIHPDYYQIPFADRQALIQAQAEEEAEEEAQEAEEERAAEAQAEAAGERTNQTAAADMAYSPDDEVSEPAGDQFEDDQGGRQDAPPDYAGSRGGAEPEGDTEFSPELRNSQDTESPESYSAESRPEVGLAEFDGSQILDSGQSDSADDVLGQSEAFDGGQTDGASDNDQSPRDHHPEEPHHDDTVESVGAVDALEEVPQRRKPRPRQYKIQEVIKRRQVLLVQVVKEERGNKGAALTTYLSLAGRYSVLMPNTGRGGGISRKITNPADRKRLKSIASELDVPEGMGVILRTAGANRTKQEVKRDFEYLLRLWENVRELTLRSTAPKLVYEEGSLIKRSIRDLYSREVEQVVVAGEDAYREAKDFMRMLMPSHARNVQLYREETPIFSRSGVEAQLDAMFSPQVTLKSGGYIVINQTEALVSIDVNSGRSTREHNIEDTALNTNLEAAEEVARQLRLRDLAGLIVIDFIDMEENRNNRAVERKMKDCLRADRARIQVGRISHFGLMEMSRQRLRTGVLESSVVACPHCRGIGQVRSISSLSLQVLRAVEEQLLRNSGHHLYVRTRPEVALYVLNQKRRHLSELETRFDLTITVTGEAPENGAGFVVERGAQVEERPERPARVVPPLLVEPEDEFEPIEDDIVDEEEPEEVVEAREPESGEGRDKRRRRRRRRGGEDRADRAETGTADDSGGVEEVESDSGMVGEVEDSGEPARAGSEDDDTDQEGRKRRRGRRGGRRRGRSRDNGAGAENGSAGELLAEGEPTEDFASDQAFGPDDPGEQDDAPLTENHDRNDGASENAGPSDPSLDGTAEPGFPSSDEEASLPAAVGEQVAGIFGSDAPADSETVDSHADEVEALSATPAGNGAQPEAGPEEPDAPAIPAPETIEASGPAAQPVEDNTPKRSGWWNRRSFF